MVLPIRYQRRMLTKKSSGMEFYCVEFQGSHFNLFAKRGQNSLLITYDYQLLFPALHHRLSMDHFPFKHLGVEDPASLLLRPNLEPRVLAHFCLADETTA